MALSSSRITLSNNIIQKTNRTKPKKIGVVYDIILDDTHPYSTNNEIGSLFVGSIFFRTLDSIVESEQELPIAHPIDKNFKSLPIKNELVEFSKATFGEDLLLDYSNFNLFFNKELIQKKGLELSKIKEEFTSYLYKQKYVKRVYSEEQILASSGSDFYLNFIANGYDPSQNGELVITFKPGYVEYSSTGTTHGSAYTYDTHVPLLFYGWHIPKGESFDRKEITQIAPTLSQLLKITYPNGTKAELLQEVLNKEER
jgi:hypothetical protein